MKITRILQLSLVGLIVSLMVSCEYEFIEIATPEPPDPEDTVSFAQEVAPIFESDGCTACHNGGISIDFTASNAYNTIMSNNLAVPFKPEESKIYTYPHPQTGDHNSRYKSNASANTVYSWIFQGALDN